MKGIKKICHRLFIDGLSGMAQGLFATLLVGTILEQVGNLVGGSSLEDVFLELEGEK